MSVLTDANGSQDIQAQSYVGFDSEYSTSAVNVGIPAPLSDLPSHLSYHEAD